MNPTRVLIVDDSATMRQILRASLEVNPKIEVIGEANDPLEARGMIASLKPDVLTLDIEMPRMDGLTFLAKLMRLHPMPVIMVSTLTQNSTTETIRALQLGAVDCVGKPANLATPQSFSDLPDKVLAAANARMVAHDDLPVPNDTKIATDAESYQPGNRIIMIGSSTGGVEALFQVLKRFPENCPPTFITQHIPANFSRSFAQRLDHQCAPKVCEAEDGLSVTKGMVVIAPGSETHLELAMRPTPRCRLLKTDKVSGHRPSVDVLFRSGIPVGKRLSAAILTGMGQDGARGLLALRNAKARTFAQNEATCVVYGMPKAAFEMGAVDKPIALNRIADALLHFK